MKINNVDEHTSYPWPTEIYIQGGKSGIVFTDNGKNYYRTAFVEVWKNDTDDKRKETSENNIFLRGEGTTIAEAEYVCWQKWQKIISCSASPMHGPFEARKYTNGAGYCEICGSWFSGVLPKQPRDPNRVASFLEKLLIEDSEEAEEIRLATLQKILKKDCKD